MALNDTVQKRLKRINELQAEIAEKERELESLLHPEKEVVLPPEFSMNAETLALLVEAGSAGMTKERILHALQEKFPRYGIDRRKVASALAYLKNGKGQIELIGRAMYKAAESPQRS